jgi:mannose-6-phosphate isomerase-like protein (cupin superfamily)
MTINILDAVRENSAFRRVLLTGQYSQVVAMALQPGEDIGMEAHTVDQVLVFIEGTGQAILNGAESIIGPGSLVHVPAGDQHNFVNTGSGMMKLYTVYAPPQHSKSTVHMTKAEAEADEYDVP